MAKRKLQRKERGSAVLMFVGALSMLAVTTNSVNLSRLSDIRNNLRHNRTLAIRDSVATKIQRASEVPTTFRMSVDPTLQGVNPEFKACLLAQPSCTMDGQTEYPIVLYSQEGANRALVPITGPDVRYDVTGLTCHRNSTNFEACTMAVQTTFTATCVGPTQSTCTSIEYRVKYRVEAAGNYASKQTLAPVTGSGQMVTQQKIFPPTPSYNPVLIRSTTLAITRVITPVERALRDAGIDNPAVIQQIIALGVTDPELARQIGEVLLIRSIFDSEMVEALVNVAKREIDLAYEIMMMSSADTAAEVIAISTAVRDIPHGATRDGMVASGVATVQHAQEIYNAINSITNNDMIRYAFALRQMTIVAQNTALARALEYANVNWNHWSSTHGIITAGVTDPPTAKLMVDAGVEDPDMMRRLITAGVTRTDIARSVNRNNIQDANLISNISNAITTAGVTDSEVVRKAVRQNLTTATAVLALQEQIFTARAIAAAAPTPTPPPTVAVATPTPAPENTGGEETGTTVVETENPGEPDDPNETTPSAGPLIGQCSSASCTLISF